MACYLIRAGETACVKIGFAADVSRRVAFLQSGNPLRLKLLRTWEGGREVEAWLHKQFTHLRIEREWFTFDHSMLTTEIDVEEATKRVNLHEKDVPAFYHARVLFDLGGLTKVASALSIDRGAVGKWPVRGIPARHWCRVSQLCEDAGLVGVTPAELARTSLLSFGTTLTTEFP